MNQSEKLAMEIGRWVVAIGAVGTLALLVIGVVWLWNIAIWRIATSLGSLKTLQEFLHWKNVQAIKNKGGEE